VEDVTRFRSGTSPLLRSGRRELGMRTSVLPAKGICPSRFDRPAHRENRGLMEKLLCSSVRDLRKKVFSSRREAGVLQGKTVAALLRRRQTFNQRFCLARSAPATQNSTPAQEMAIQWISGARENCGLRVRFTHRVIVSALRFFQPPNFFTWFSGISAFSCINQVPRNLAGVGLHLKLFLHSETSPA